MATPVYSTAIEAGHVFKNAPGNVYYANAMNGTSTPCLLVIVDAAAIPTEGAVAVPVIDAVPLPPYGRATYSLAATAPSAASTTAGLAAFLSSNTATPLTKVTTGLSACFTGIVP